MGISPSQEFLQNGIQEQDRQVSPGPTLVGMAVSRRLKSCYYQVVLHKLKTSSKAHTIRPYCV